MSGNPQTGEDKGRGSATAPGSEIEQPGSQPKTPRPQKPFVPGPIISEPDATTKLAVPLPPKPEK